MSTYIILKYTPEVSDTAAMLGIWELPETGAQSRPPTYNDPHIFWSWL